MCIRDRIPGPYLYGNEDVEWRQYVRTVDQLAELFNSLGLETDADTVRATIENYDKAIMAGEQPEGCLLYTSSGARPLG